MHPWSEPDVIESLDREPYGVALAERMWDAFLHLEVGQGIQHGHRDYCGIGLLKTESGVGIFQIYDGSSEGPPLIEWVDRGAFVRWWSRQSDHGLSGADTSYPELLSRSDFELNNQRLHRHWIRWFLQNRGE